MTNGTGTVRLGVIGCGDVAFRTYLASLQSLAGRAEVVACFDPIGERVKRFAGHFAHARAYDRYDDLLAHEGLDGVLNLTPAPLHCDTTSAALDAGLHCFSEKPIASTIEQANELIDRARQRERLLLCAPAVMATERFKWLRKAFATGRFGRPTLATAQMAGMGPAGWRAYTGDPAVFYAAGVGPLVDVGIYSLHAMTGLFGPARRVQAMGGVAIPQRTVTIERLAGQTIEVEANDHMLVHLDFGDNIFGQLLASFALPKSHAPALELHGSLGSVSISLDEWYNGNGPSDVFVRDESPLGVEGWMRGVVPPAVAPYENVIGAGPAHFVACLRGEEEPVLTAAHACHVLEIMLKAEQSTREGRALDLESTF